MKFFQVLYVFLLWIGLHLCCEEQSLPVPIRHLCKCEEGPSLVCKGLNSTKGLEVPKPSINDIQAPTNPFDKVVALHIQDSKIQCIDLAHLMAFPILRTLSVTKSGLSTFLCANSNPIQLPAHLQRLNLAGNFLTQVSKEDLDHLQHLQELDLSQNRISDIPSRAFSKLSKLQKLNLSNNRLNENLNPTVFKTLPTSLENLDISSKLHIFSIHD